jgi:hypothetical protein
MEGIITEDAFATLSEKLSTPLQFEFYLTRALEEAYKVGQKPVGADMIDNVLAKDINGLEPRLTAFASPSLAGYVHSSSYSRQWC